MTTPTIEVIQTHGSVRNYKPDPVPKRAIEQIVAAAQRASTSSNLQLYSVVALPSLEKRTRMQALCGGQKHISQAPVFLTWCADLSRIDRICQQKDYPHAAGNVENFLLAAVDAAIAMQTAGLAAESLGLGFCFIGAIRNNPRAVIDLLGLPHLSFPLCGMTIGWPATQPKIRPRLPLNALLHWDEYDTSTEKSYWTQYDQEMISTGIYSGRQVTPEDPLPESEYGWTEHTARRMGKSLRPHLRSVLLEMGFELK
jgi:FMN reductase (NADPH)